MTAFLWVNVLGAICGALSLQAFRRWSRLDLLRTLSNLVIAHLLEIRLFADEPRFVMRAQRDLIAANGRILFHLLPPALILLLPFAAILSLAETFFGHLPLRAGQTALVTVQFKELPLQAEIATPQGVEVDSPPLFIPIDRQVVWRVRAVRLISGNLEIISSGTSVRKRITVADGLAWAPVSRSHLSFDGEWPLSDKAIRSIDIGYPAATIFRLHWLVWFTLSSLIAAGTLSLLT